MKHNRIIKFAVMLAVAATMVFSGCGHDHVYTRWVKTLDPTCTEYGTEQSTCNYCKKTVRRNIQPIGHEYGEWQIETAPTQETDGLAKKVCTRDETHVVEQVLPGVVEHRDAYTVQRVLKKPTFRENGTDRYTFEHELGNIQVEVSVPSYGVSTVAHAVEAGVNSHSQVLSGVGTVFDPGSGNGGITTIEYQFGNNYSHIRSYTSTSMPESDPSPEPGGGSAHMAGYENKSADGVSSLAEGYGSTRATELMDLNEYWYEYKSGSSAIFAIYKNSSSTVQLRNVIPMQMQGFEFHLNSLDGTLVYGVEQLVQKFYKSAKMNLNGDFVEEIVPTADGEGVDYYRFASTYSYAGRDKKIDVKFKISPTSFAFTYVNINLNGYTYVFNQQVNAEYNEEQSGSADIDNPYSQDKVAINDIVLTRGGKQYTSGSTISVSAREALTFDLTFMPSTVQLQIDSPRLYYRDGDNLIPMEGTSYSDGCIDGYISQDFKSIYINCGLAGNYELVFRCMLKDYVFKLDISPITPPQGEFKSVLYVEQTFGTYMWTQQSNVSVYSMMPVSFTSAVSIEYFQDKSFRASVTSRNGEALTEAKMQEYGVTLKEGVIDGVKVYTFTAREEGSYIVTMRTYFGDTKVDIAITIKPSPKVEDLLKGRYDNEKDNVTVIFNSYNTVSKSGTLTIKDTKGTEERNFTFVKTVNDPIAETSIISTYVSGVKHDYDVGLTNSYYLFTKVPLEFGDLYRTSYLVKMGDLPSFIIKQSEDFTINATKAQADEQLTATFRYMAENPTIYEITVFDDAVIMYNGENQGNTCTIECTRTGVYYAFYVKISKPTTEVKVVCTPIGVSGAGLRNDPYILERLSENGVVTVDTNELTYIKENGSDVLYAGFVANVSGKLSVKPLTASYFAIMCFAPGDKVPTVLVADDGKPKSVKYVYETEVTAGSTYYVAFTKKGNYKVNLTFTANA